MIIEDLITHTDKEYEEYFDKHHVKIDDYDWYGEKRVVYEIRIPTLVTRTEYEIIGEVDDRRRKEIEETWKDHDIKWQNGERLTLAIKKYGLLDSGKQSYEEIRKKFIDTFRHFEELGYTESMVDFNVLGRDYIKGYVLFDVAYDKDIIVEEDNLDESNSD